MGKGDGGNIVIRADQMTVTGSVVDPDDPHAITTSATLSSTGKAGNIRLTANALTLVDSRIASRSEGAGKAGNITIANTDSVLLQGNSQITTEATRADGGNITLTRGALVRLQDSHITARAVGGEEATGGNITINAASVVLQNSTITTDASKQGGDIRIAGGVLLVDPASRISATGERAGDIDLPPTNNLSGLVTPLPPDFAVAAALQPNRCLARLQEGRVSSLVVGGRSGVPPEPEGGLPSLLLEAAWEAAADDSQKHRPTNPPGRWTTAQAQRQAGHRAGPVHLVSDPACAR
jgi:large exoprotein involved in heme utilization and adhesion